MCPPGYYQSANGLMDGKSCNRTSCAQIHESLLGHWRISNIERVHCLSFGLHMYYAHLTSVWSEYFVNTFVFNSKFYLQIRGCPMGTICAPAYANIFMAEFEKKNYFWIKDKLILLLGYIDDILMVWDKYVHHVPKCMSYYQAIGGLVIPRRRIVCLFDYIWMTLILPLYYMSTLCVMSQLWPDTYFCVIQQISINTEFSKFSILRNTCVHSKQRHPRL